MAYTKYLRWAILGGLCLVLFVPFIVADGGIFPNMFFPYITGKNFIFRILVEIIFGLYVLLALREPKYRPRASTLLWVLGAFVLWGAIAVFTSVDPVKSFWSNFERMDGYITLIHLFALTLVASSVLTAEKWWERFFQISIGASVIMGIDSLFQLMHLFGFAPSSQSGPRLDGTFGNATYLAVYMLFNIFITLFLAVRDRKNKALQSFYGIALIFQIITLYYTETRGALLGFIGGIVIAAIYIAWKGTSPEWKTLRKISLWGLGALVALLLLFLGIRNTSFVQNSDTLQRFASISLTDRTTISRFTIWHMAYEGIKEKPLFGWGQENFSYVFNKYYDPSMYDQEQWFDRAHNEFIDWAVDGGIPAFALYLSLFILAGLAIARAESLSVPERGILLGLLAGYAINNLVVFDNLTSYIYFFLILAFAHSLSRRELPGKVWLAQPLSNQSIAIAAPILIVIFCWGGWVLNAPGIARAEALLTAVETGSQSDFQAAWNINGQLGKQEVAEQAIQFASNTVAPSTTLSPEVKQNFYTFAHDTMLQMMMQRQNDARLELFMGGFLNTFGQHAEALTHLQHAQQLSPDKQAILFEIGVNTYLAQGDVKDAVPVLKQAFELAPSYSDARLLYASALYYAGDSTDADALLVQGFGTVLVDDDRLIQVYINTKQFSRAEAIWQNRIAKTPDDAQNYIGLANAYFVSGDTASAVTALKKVAQLNPSLAPQVQSLIQQIESGALKP
jgi:O-antigen ligase/Flp pilus assembly protein TadD